MINKIPKKLNKKNLIDVSKILNESGIDYSIFYGTALGIHRDKDILDHDDDIDFIIDSKELTKINNLLSNLGFVQSVFVSGIFLQVTRILDGTLTYIDFYTYQNVNKDVLVDKWNFRGTFNSPSTHLHFNRDLILPTREIIIFDSLIRIPNDIERTCKFLYGTRYKETLIKGVDYLMTIQNNKPNIIYLR